jgi:RES domain-containing protein
MKVYRLAKATYINDMSGIGARIAGGRWNLKGTAVIYTAQNRSLATVEYLVHVPIAIQPRGLVMASLEIPDSVPQTTINISDLPPNWKDYPPPPELAIIGTDWVNAKETLLLFVPSVVVSGEQNILINVSHPDMRHVKFLNAESYEFEGRLFH